MESEALDLIPRTASPQEAESVLRDAGWRTCGEGDWATALISQDGALVVRISPFDPVGPFTARLYREAAHTGQVPRLYAHRRLAGGGDLQMMEALEPVPQQEAADFLVALPADLARIVEAVHRAASAALPWCGPLDANPSNVMRRPGGPLVLADPFYADGPDLYRTAREDPDLLVARIPEAERRRMTRIPLAESGPWPEEERAALAEALAAADARLRRRTGPGRSAPTR